MANDDGSIQPIAPVGSEPVEASSPTGAVSPPGAAGAASTGPAGALPLAPGAAVLGDAVEVDEVTHPVATPADVDARATVHDAALHGGRMARAIEQAATSRGPDPAVPGSRPDVNDRAQQLGGAMASASSGQASPRPDAPDVDDPQPDHVDPLAPISRVEAESHRRDDRHRAEGEDDGDVHP